MKSLVCAAVVSLGAWIASPARAVQAEALTLQGLIHRPDLWPPAVILSKDFSFAGANAIKAGQTVKVLEFDGSQLVVDAGNDLVFGITPDDCDLLVAANRAWSTLTPAQRGVDPHVLAKDASLWPERVSSSAAFALEDGTRIEPGGEYEFLFYDGQNVKFYSRQHQTMLEVALAQTDLVARARQRVLLEPAARSSRIAAALKKNLVDSTGKPFTSAGIDEAKLYVLYYGASWCPPCRRFSPRLVEFVNGAAKDNPRMATVLLSNDKDDADMQEYMHDEKMPWPAMPLESLRASPLFLSYAGGSIPHLVVLDRHGMVLASSVENGRYVGVDQPLATLAKLLEAGKAR